MCHTRTRRKCNHPGQVIYACPELICRGSPTSNAQYLEIHACTILSSAASCLPCLNHCILLRSTYPNRLGSWMNDVSIGMGIAGDQSSMYDRRFGSISIHQTAPWLKITAIAVVEGQRCRSVFISQLICLSSGATRRWIKSGCLDLSWNGILRSKASRIWPGKQRLLGCQGLITSCILSPTAHIARRSRNWVSDPVRGVARAYVSLVQCRAACPAACSPLWVLGEDNVQQVGWNWVWKLIDPSGALRAYVLLRPRACGWGQRATDMAHYHTG